MPPKRSLEFSSPPPPAKRVAGPSFTEGSSSSSIFATPRTPKRYSLPAPSDSPTNPFGLNRPLKANPLKLPPPMSYSKYVALRMQVVVHPSRDDMYEDGKMPPFRIVHVPINYSFKLFQKLIMFMFECDPADALKARDANAGGHLFEIVKSVGMFDSKERPGQMQSGCIIAKLSSERDPYFRPGGLEGEVEADEGDEEAVWSWENEEEFTLENVWPRGSSLRRGLIYHHNDHTTLHITINTVPLPSRKGTGNRPYTFFARGHINLNELPTPEPSPSHPQARIPLYTRTPTIFPSGKNALSLPPWIMRPKDMDEAISVIRWNAATAWETYLDRCKDVDRRIALAEARRRKRKEQENEIPSSDPMPSSDISFVDAPTPGLTLLSSSSPFLDNIPPTPAPVQPLHKLIVDRTSRRLSLLAQKGLRDFESDEEEELDELAGDDDGEDSFILASEADLRHARGHGMIRGIDVDEDGRRWETDVAKERKREAAALKDEVAI
ncbi:hypothetical protein NEOLEDRAFT_1151487 [Neolentinus lepideus HHB14362 ss-1]|uniref:Uncharacterized protein n=1 Tax=Neolentinus lepideus HHB14362 ss-1 TaxID=1314782 RepID=A0A165NW51_9AGAM|nr:hypothetical protein NEOLEDRAFT_1151487 [Neolentinus lepideus HHB14362 ss-1]